MLKLVTWNVLHRVHAENWAEPIIGAHADEAARVAAITAKIAGLDDDIVALQEVSGDQLASIRAHLGRDRSILEHRYRRIPKLKRPSSAVVADPTEHLVVLVRGEATLVGSHTFSDDGGKGYLAVEHVATGLLVVCTHITYGDPRANQIGTIADLATRRAGPTVITGDFNADAETVLAALGSGFATVDPAAGGLATRPRVDAAHKPLWIDHLVTHRAVGEKAEVFSADGLSDHNLVRCCIQI